MLRNEICSKFNVAKIIVRNICSKKTTASPNFWFLLIVRKEIVSKNNVSKNDQNIGNMVNKYLCEKSFENEELLGFLRIARFSQELLEILIFSCKMNLVSL